MRQETHMRVSIIQKAKDAVSLLSEESELPKGRVKFAMQQGAVWITRGKSTQRLRRVKKPLMAGDELHLYYDEDVLNQDIPEPTLVADEGDYSVWNKPYGLLSQGSKWGDHMSLGRWVERNLTPQRNAFVVHRLDRAANGIMMIAHTKQAAAMLSGLFQERKIEKKYRVSVHGQFPEETQRFNRYLDGKTAVSHATRMAYLSEENISRLEVSIETGRKHQIRKHLSGAGFPVVGDRLYGTAEIDEQSPNLQLQAFYLKFFDTKAKQEREYKLPI